MKTIVPHYYKDFKCIASKCTDTCCAGWEIIIDDETYTRYNKVCGEFGKRLKSNLTLYEDGASGFVLQNRSLSLNHRIAILVNFALIHYEQLSITLCKHNQ